MSNDFPTLAYNPTQRAKPRNITIEDRFWEYAKAIGDGNASAGFRIALKAHEGLELCEQDQGGQPAPQTLNSKT